MVILSDQGKLAAYLNIQEELQESCEEPLTQLRLLFQHLVAALAKGDQKLGCQHPGALF